LCGLVVRPQSWFGQSLGCGRGILASLEDSKDSRVMGMFVFTNGTAPE
jgi:hypothetical protein